MTSAIRRRLEGNVAIWALFALSAAWIAAFALRVHVYFVMPDEVRYVKQAIDIWSHFRLLGPGDTDFATWSQAQPLLMAPLWGLFRTSTAYQLTHVLNSVVLASAVFPAYLLGRRVLGSRLWGLVAAVLTVVVPWSVMAGVMMTENVAYPLSLWAILAVQRAVTEPSQRADLIALGALVLAFLGRTQLIFLAPALPLGLLAHGLRYPQTRAGAPTRRVRTVVREHPLVFGLVAIVGVILIARPKALLGDAPRHGPFEHRGWFTAREMLAYLAIGIGMVPLALSAAWAAVSSVRPLDPARHAYAVILIYVGLVMTIEIGGGSVAFTNGVNDRYVCYLAPLLMIGMLACLLERRRMTVAILAAAAGCAWVASGSKLEEVGQSFVSPTAAWHKVLYGHAPRIGKLFGAYALSPQHLMAWGTIVALVAIVLLKRWVSPALLAGAVAAAVGVWCLAETTYTRNKLLDIQPAAGYANGRDWVDRALPYGAQADLLLSSLGDRASATNVFWDLTFWNHDVHGTLVPFGANSWRDQAFPKRFGVNPSTGRVVSGLKPGHYLIQGVADRRFGFLGQTPVGAPVNNLQISAVAAPINLAWAHLAIDETGFVPAGQGSLLRVFGDGAAGLHTVTITVGPRFADRRPAVYVVSKNGRRVATGAVAHGHTRTLTVHVRLPARGHFDIFLGAPARAGSAGVQFYGASVAFTSAQ